MCFVDATSQLTRSFFTSNGILNVVLVPILLIVWLLHHTRISTVYTKLWHYKSLIYCWAWKDQYWHSFPMLQKDSATPNGYVFTFSRSTAICFSFAIFPYGTRCFLPTSLSSYQDHCVGAFLSLFCIRNNTTYIHINFPHHQLNLLCVLYFFPNEIRHSFEYMAMCVDCVGISSRKWDDW